MATRSGIIAGKTVIVVQVQESVDKALSTISTKLNKFSNNVNKLGLELFTGGLFGTFLTTNLTNQFKEFEDRILFLSTKLRASDKDFAAVTERIRELGRTTSFTAVQVAEGATALAQAGLNAREVQDTLLPTLDLARGAQIELSAAGAILVNTIRSYGLETTKANEVASQFIAASRLGTLEVLDLKESIKEVLGTVRTLNIDLPTTLALITQLAERSLKGTKAGTSLNTALLQLASKKKQLKESLGIDLPDNIDGDRFILFLEELYNRINRLGNLQRVAVLQRLFNIRGGRAITGLDDIKKVIDLQKQIRAAGDEARKAAVVMDSGLGGSIRIATSAVQDLSISLGSLIGLQLKPLLDIVPAFANALEGLATANAVFTTGLLLTPPALLGVGAGLLALSFVGGKVAGVIGTLAGSFRLISGKALTVLNSQVVLLEKGLRGIGRQGTKVDQGLSALFLTPRKRPTGRKAGQVIPSSFFGRTGASSLTGTGAAARKLITLFEKLTPNTANAGKVFSVFITVVGKIETALNRLPVPLKTVVTILTAFGSLLKTLSSPALENFIKGGNFLTAIRTLQVQFRLLSRSVSGYIVALKGGLNTVTKWSFIYTKLISLSGKIGKVFSKLTPDFSKLGNNKTAVFFTSLSNFLINVRKSLARGNLAKLFDAKSFSTLGSLFSKSGLGKATGGGLNLIGKVLTTLTSGLRSLTRIDYVRGLFNITKGFLAFGKGLFTVLNGVRRFVFSFSGIFTILELLLIFGPKIKFIREAFERLGEGISAAAKTIGGTFKDLGPVFKLFSTSFGEILKGNGDAGVFGIVKGFGLLSTIVGSNLVIAFNQLKEAVAPLYDTLRQITLSIVEVFKLVGSLVGTTFSNIGAGLQGVTGGGAGSLVGSVLESIKAAFSAENLKLAFAGVAGFFVSIAQNINNLLQNIFKVINTTMNYIQSAIAGLFTFIKTASLNAFVGLDGSGFISGPLKTIFGQIASAAEGLSKTFTATADENAAASETISTGFADGAKAIDKANTKFLAGLDKIFSVSTEANAQIAQDEAQFNKDIARFDAARLTSAVQTNNIFTDLGKKLADFNTTLKTNLVSGPLGSVGSFLSGGGPGAFNLGALGAFGQKALSTGVGNLDQKKLTQSKIKELQLEQKLSLQNSKVRTQANIDKLTNLFSGNVSPQSFISRLFSLEKDIAAGNTGAAAGVQSRADRIKELRAQLRAGRSALQTSSLRDIVSATVGTFRQTRGNLLKVAGGKSIEQQQLSTLQGIQENTGGANTSLTELVKKAQPLVFQ